MTVEPVRRSIMTSSIAVPVALCLLVSACAGSEQPSAAAADSAEPVAVPATGPMRSTSEGADSGVVVAVPQQRLLHLDVRTPAEYDAGHVAGTLHIPLDELEQRWQELASYRDQHIIVYCRTGRRSAAAIELLRSRGFDHLENGGGVAQMAARGLPMEPETCC